MSERTHSPAAAGRTRPWMPLVTITGLAVLGGGILMQGWKAPGARATINPNAAPAQAAVETTQKPLARVNDQYISYEQVAQECVNRVGKDVLENLVNRAIIQQEAQRRGITVSEAEVNNEVATIAGRFNLPVDTWYQMLTSERGISAQQYRADIIWPKLALQKLAGEEITVSEDEMKNAFQREYGPRVRCRMIQLDNIRRANDIWQKATANPDDFEKLAREYSTDPNSRALGGAFPPVPRHSGLPQLEDVAFRLKPGEISGLVQMGINEYVILKCEGYTDPVVTDIEDVRAELYAQIVEDKTTHRAAAVFEKLKETARVDNYLTGKSTGTLPVAGAMTDPRTATVTPASAQR